MLIVLVLPAAEYECVVMWLTSHQQSVVLQKGVHVLEHNAVHLWKDLGSLQEPDVHHCRFVEDCWRVLHKSEFSIVRKVFQILRGRGYQSEWSYPCHVHQRNICPTAILYS